jgi:predicted nucleic acid-binding Zn ribbon protein
MNCPNCGTFNPEERTTCWRCDKELPKPKPQKKRTQQQTARTWFYVVIAIFVLITLLQMCGFRLPFGPASEPGPTGALFYSMLVL